MLAGFPRGLVAFSTDVGLLCCCCFVVCLLFLRGSSAIQAVHERVDAKWRAGVDTYTVVISFTHAIRSALLSQIQKAASCLASLTSVRIGFWRLVFCYQANPPSPIFFGSDGHLPTSAYILLHTVSTYDTFLSCIFRTVRSVSTTSSQPSAYL